MNMGWQAAEKRNKQLELVRFLHNVIRATNVLADEKEKKIIDDIASTSVISIIKINLDWPSYSEKHRKYVCTELADLDKAFEILKGQLKEASSTFIISKEVDSIVDRISKCKSNQQRNTDAGADAPPPVR